MQNIEDDDDEENSPKPPDVIHDMSSLDKSDQVKHKIYFYNAIVN